MEAITTFRGRIINKSDIDLINRIIEAHSQKSRRFISQEVCRVWNWRQPNGHLKDMICRSLLLLLESKGFIKLPARKCTPPNPLANRKKPEEIPVDQSSIQCPLKQLLPVSLHQVRRTTDEKLFNSLIEHYHYLGYTQPAQDTNSFHLKYAPSIIISTRKTRVIFSALLVSFSKARVQIMHSKRRTPSILGRLGS